MEWVLFHVLIAVLLIIDLCVLRRSEPPEKVAKKALIWSLFWIIAALGFNFFIYLFQGTENALQFFTAYVVEKSLSIDNLFVFLMIFQSFRISEEVQHKILYLGLISAMIMRFALILTGYALIERFEWVLYILGGILVLTGIKFLFTKAQKFDWHKLPFAKWLEKKYAHRGVFFVLLLIESSDLLFALDSIPAVFSITSDLYIAYTSNVFAILGLRALYMLVASHLKRIRYLKVGLALILIFVGSKKLISPIYSISIGASLFVIVLIMVCSFVLSKRRARVK